MVQIAHGNRETYGIVDVDGNVIFSNDFGYRHVVSYFGNDTFGVSGTGGIGGWGAVDSNNNVLIPLQYDEIMPISFVLPYSNLNPLMAEFFIVGFTDYFIREIPLANGRVGRERVSTGRRVGVVDRSGNIIIPIEYGWFRLTESGRYIMALIGEVGRSRVYDSFDLFDITGRMITNSPVGNIIELNTGIFAVGDFTGEFRNGELVYNWGVVDSNGNFIIPQQYHHISYDVGLDMFLARIPATQMYNLYDGNGRLISENHFVARFLSENLISANTNSGYRQILDYQGNIIESRISNYTSNFNHGIALTNIVERGVARYGFVNTSGQTIIPFDFDGSQNRNWAWRTDLTGIPFVNPREVFSYQNFAVTRNGNWYVLSLNPTP